MSKGRTRSRGTAFVISAALSALDVLKNRDDRFLCPTADQASPQPGRPSCE
jgi:hypothetical protein